MTYNKENYRQYFKDRVDELTKINQAIWGFVGAAALIEHGTQLANKGKSDPESYKEFVKTFGSKYTDFTYNTDNKQDLNVQIYHVLRCGLLHSFCLQADKAGEKWGGRTDSIIITSLADAKRRGEALKAEHNLSHIMDNGRDACLLILEPFLVDIGNAINQLFDNQDLDESIKKSWKEHPPFSTFMIGIE